MRLLLVRHGETEQNASGFIQGQQPGVLTSRGIEQANALARRLKTETLDLAYSSDLARAADTMKAIHQFHPRLKVEYLPELRERALGIYEGRHGQFYHDGFIQSGTSRLEFKPEGGESILEVKQRTDLFLKRLREQSSQMNVLVCTHGGVITTLLANLLESPVEEMLSYNFKNTSLTALELTNAAVHVVEFNSVTHLADLRPPAGTGQ